MTMELQVLKNEQKFEWNFEAVKEKLSDDIKKYTDLVVSETNLADMEKTQKEIASLRIKLQKFRISVKKDLEKPYEAFELQVKELAVLVESAEKPIKDQLEKYEDARKETKRNECQNIINTESLKLGLESKYSSQIVIDSKWLNKGPTIKSITEEIQIKVCWFLDIQKQEKEAETFKQQKIEMAKFMIESLSAGLVTPLTFQDVENKIDYLNITELRTYIENQVAIRKGREERAKQVALEQEEQRRIAEVVEQARIEQERKQTEFEHNQSFISNNRFHIEHVEKLAKINEPPAPTTVKTTDKLYNVQFVCYEVTSEQIRDIGEIIAHRNIEFKHSVKEV
jgi:ribosomal protein S18